MKKTSLITFLLVLISFFIFSSALSAQNYSSGQNSKKFTESDVKKCIASKEKEARQKGYPIMDPFASRIQCIKELKGE